MNRLIICFFPILIFSACEAAPQDAMSSFYTKHRSDSAVQQINIPTLLLRFCSGDPDLKKALHYMKSLKIFTMEGNGNNYIREDLNKAIVFDGYQDALQITDGADHIRILIREEGNLIKNVLIAIDNKEELMLLQARTKITYDQLGKMMNGLQNGKSGLRQVSKS